MMRKLKGIVSLLLERRAEAMHHNPAGLIAYQPTGATPRRRYAPHWKMNSDAKWTEGGTKHLVLWYYVGTWKVRERSD
jgi:hypothetical protein